MANSFAPVQLLRTDWNPDIWTAFDNGTDQRTQFAVTMNPSTLPTDKNKYGVCCILCQYSTAKIFLNIGTTDIPNWQPFGPGTNSLPTPFIAGDFLTNDGTNASWATAYNLFQNQGTSVTERGTINLTNFLTATDVASKTQLTVNMAAVEAFLLSDNTWLTNLANNSVFDNALANSTTFITDLLANTSFISSLVTIINATGLTEVVTDATLTGNGTTGSPLHVVGGGGGSGGLGGSSDIIVRNDNNATAIDSDTANATYDPVSGRYYYAPSGSNNLVIYIKNPYGSWVIESVVTMPNGIIYGTTSAIYGICTDSNFVYVSTLAPSGGGDHEVDIVRLNINGTSAGAAVVVGNFVTGAVNSFYPVSISTAQMSLFINGSILYARVYYNRGSGNYDHAEIIPFTVLGNTYTPGTNYNSLVNQSIDGNGGRFDGTFFYFGGQKSGAGTWTEGYQISKFSVSGTSLVFVSSQSFPTLSRGIQYFSGSQVAMTNISNIYDNGTTFTLLTINDEGFPYTSGTHTLYRTTLRSDTFVRF